MKKLKTCMIEGCKKSGETILSYYLCGNHWNMVRFYALNGSNQSKYILSHAKKGNMLKDDLLVEKDLNHLEKELKQEGLIQ